jgi:hypothetical protein
MVNRELTATIGNDLQDRVAEAKRECTVSIAVAKEWAENLVPLVEKYNMAIAVQGKEYLTLEAWEVIGRFAKVNNIIEWTHPWRSHDGDLGYEARCVLKDFEGNIVGSGESSCGFDALPVHNRRGSDRDKVARSAAQSWASSRALRLKFGYVVKLGGRYEPVPFEEMQMLHSSPPPPQNPPPAPSPSPSAGYDASTDQRSITEPQRRRIFSLLKNASDRSSEDLKRYLKAEWGLDSTEAILRSQYEEICAWVTDQENEPGGMG